MKFKSIFLLSLLSPSALFAAPLKQYPYISGDALVQVSADRVLTTQKSGVPANNGFVYIQQNTALNFNKNWSVKTQLRLQPNNVLTTRDQVNPERYRNFLSNDRGFSLNNTGIILEEIKVNYENEDFRAFAGKFDPTFGTAWRKTKRIGVFAAQLTEDYNLREKLGAGGAALLENSTITVNAFMNDSTGLSRSMINDRGEAANSGAGSGKALTSYSVAMEGENFLTVDNWYYNLGYRSLGSNNKLANSAREQGYVFGSEYLYKVSRNTSIIPFVELVKMDNFGGIKNRSGKYATFAVIGNYLSWTGSVSLITRNLRNTPSALNSHDRQMQFSMGYKFTDNLTLDVTRANVREDRKDGTMLGATLSYFYKF